MIHPQIQLKGGHLHYVPVNKTVTTLAFQRTNTIRCRWNRFNLYAPFVKRLRIAVEKHDGYDSTVIAFIALCRPTHLIPTLQSLEVNCCKSSQEDDYVLELAFLCVDEGLRDLSITTDGTIEPQHSLFGFGGLSALGAFLDVVATRSPDLRTFKFNYVNALGG